MNVPTAVLGLGTDRSPIGTSIAASFFRTRYHDKATARPGGTIAAA